MSTSSKKFQSHEYVDDNGGALRSEDSFVPGGLLQLKRSVRNDREMMAPFLSNSTHSTSLRSLATTADQKRSSSTQTSWICTEKSRTTQPIVYGDALIEIEDQPTETCSNQGLERVAITSVLTFVSLPKHPMLDEDDIDVPMAW
ncbi:hypothetical protein CVT26_015424 [Gymnopilus dilepis]|uniref:Uncharacterized protein n=1 Tax=Gymnopilus dilepis TaxID=231916 RepID=A0A409YEG7_9AGAR|nr:hypothetical protein CVT26_015424 [Gymnopilus dilepis]